MGRRPKPATLHMRQGTYKPSEHRVSPMADGAIQKPSDLGQWGNRLWDTSIAFILQAGGGECDTEAVAGMCRWYNEYRRVHEKVRKTSPTHKDYRTLLYTAAKAWEKFMDGASRFGLTPADRAKLKHDVEETKGALDRLMGARSA